MKQPSELDLKAMFPSLSQQQLDAMGATLKEYVSNWLSGSGLPSALAPFEAVTRALRMEMSAPLWDRWPANEMSRYVSELVDERSSNVDVQQLAEWKQSFDECLAEADKQISGDRERLTAAAILESAFMLGLLLGEGGHAAGIRRPQSKGGAKGSQTRQANAEKWKREVEPLILRLAPESKSKSDLANLVLREWGRRTPRLPVQRTIVDHIDEMIATKALEPEKRWRTSKSSETK